LSSHITKEEALEYHIGGKTGMEIKTSCNTQRELALAYSPGVAEPCLEIHRDEELAYLYTNKSNLVAVISDSSAVLGLGELAPIAGKPVMEGKCILFKKFGLIDGVDIMIDEKDPDKIVEICRAISPTFGGINLEDIKAPKCFEIEKKLQALVDIPVMHDDQHGTAIITTAGLINALDLTQKDISTMKIIIMGAGAAAITCAKMYRLLGAINIIMLDSKGVISTHREDLNIYKQEFAVDTKATTLQEVIVGADMFLGLSHANLLTKEMVAMMNVSPIIFALANPTPEIFPEEIEEVRDDAIIGTGRSDYPNQINNVLGFPYIFRGALDVRARKITEGMKMAAAVALAKVAREKVVPTKVKNAYNKSEVSYGKTHIIPTPFNRDAFVAVSLAVATSAIEEGVARLAIDLVEYEKRLNALK